MAELAAEGAEGDEAVAGDEKGAPPPYSPAATTSTPGQAVAPTPASNVPTAGSSITDTVLGDRESNKEVEEQITSDQYMQQQQFAANTNAANNKFIHTGDLSTQRTSELSSLMSQNYNDLVAGLTDYYTADIAALAQAGLPAYLAFDPSAMASQPDTTQMTSGGWGYTSSLPGNPMSSTYSPNPFGWGDLIGD